MPGALTEAGIPSRFTSVTPWRPSTGVSTSSTCRCAKKPRTQASSCARLFRTSREAEGCQTGFSVIDRDQLLFTRLTYSPERVSTFSTSPIVINSGTLTTAPVDRVAGLEPPWAVSPFMPGSVSTTSSSTKLGGVTVRGAPLYRVTVYTSCSFSHLTVSPIVLASAAYCSKEPSVSMKCQNSPSVYRYSMSWSITSAASRVSPDLKVRSHTRLLIRLRSLTRLKAWPLPGLTNSFSSMIQGSPSSKTLRPLRNSLVEYEAMKCPPDSLSLNFQGSL